MSKPAMWAIKKLLLDRGYVVIGLPPEETTEVAQGDFVRSFAGARISGSLVIDRPTSREDWDVQVALLFGDAGVLQHPRDSRQRFFRCVWAPAEVEVVVSGTGGGVN